MRPSSPLTLILASCVLAGCAGTGAAPAGGEVAPSAAASPYGLFLAGRAASAQGQSGRAADLYQRASVRSGGAAFLGQRAFQAALAAGDIPRAAELAPQGAAVEDLELRQLGLMVRGADALARGRAAAALTTLGTEDIAMPHRGAAALLTQWAAAGAGQTDRALADPDVGNDVIAAYFGRLSRARILERSGRPVEAERGLRELLGQGDPDSMATLALGGLLERSGSRCRTRRR